MEEKPLKRNANIVILSREHHHGLLFAWKLRQGLKAQTEPARMAKYVSWFWDKHLMSHFRDEENLLFSGVQHSLVDAAIQQHAVIKDLIHRISGDNQSNAEAFARLADLVTDHIRLEERELSLPGIRAYRRTTVAHRQ